MVPPVISAFLLQFVSWRGTFGVLIAAGAVNLAASFFFEETLSESDRYKGSFWSTFGRLAVVGKNVGFTGVLTYTFYTSDAAEYLPCIDLGARRIIKEISSSLVVAYLSHKILQFMLSFFSFYNYYIVFFHL